MQFRIDLAKKRKEDNAGKPIFHFDSTQKSQQSTQEENERAIEKEFLVKLQFLSDNIKFYSDSACS